MDHRVERIQEPLPLLAPPGHLDAAALLLLGRLGRGRFGEADDWACARLGVGPHAGEAPSSFADLGRAEGVTRTEVEQRLRVLRTAAAQVGRPDSLASALRLASDLATVSTARLEAAWIEA